MQRTAETRQVAVTSTITIDEPQIDMDDALAASASFEGLLLLASSWTNPAIGLQETESKTLPDRATAENVRLTGFMSHVALGVVGVGAIVMDAYERAISDAIATPMIRCGRYRPITGNKAPTPLPLTI